MPKPTTQQLRAIIDEQPPSWEHNPPQREEFSSDVAYDVALFRYARRVFAARNPPDSFEVIDEDVLV